jgi:hypothetical protein
MYRLNSLGVVHLIDEMREAGASDAIAVLAARIAAAAPLDRPREVASLTQHMKREEGHRRRPRTRRPRCRHRAIRGLPGCART